MTLQRKSLWIVVLNIVSITACMNSSLNQPILGDQYYEAYDLSDGLYGGSVAWLDENTLVVDYTQMLYGQTPTLFMQLWTITPSGDELTHLAIPPTLEPCHTHAVRQPRQLPDGRLGYTEICITTAGALHPHIMAYDLEDSSVEKLLEFPFRSSGVGTGGITWNQDLSLGIGSDAHGITLAERLVWLPRDGEWEYVELDLGLSHSPAWSPDYTQIAFVGSPNASHSPLNIDTRNIYVMEADNPQTASVVLRDVSTAYLSWTPDGNYLVFGGSVGSKRGLYLLNVNSGNTHLLLEGRMISTAWSPDGQRVATIQMPQEPVDSSGNDVISGFKLLIIDITMVFRDKNLD